MKQDAMRVRTPRVAPMYRRLSISDVVLLITLLMMISATIGGAISEYLHRHKAVIDANQHNETLQQRAADIKARRQEV